MDKRFRIVIVVVTKSEMDGLCLLLVFQQVAGGPRFRVDAEGELSQVPRVRSVFFQAFLPGDRFGSSGAKDTLISLFL